MDIPVNAKVVCQDQECGKITCVIIHPIRKMVTHIAVQEKGIAGIERLIPVEKILESRPDQIVLGCTLKEFSGFDSFIESRFVGGDEQFLGYEPEHHYYHPYINHGFDEEFEYEPMFEAIEYIPADELGIHRGATVQATDGKAGQVDEFLISPLDDKISHLVLREGHLWGQRHITIPVSEIDRIETDQVYLKLSRQAINALPFIPVKRHFS